jgi:hypothetical protein
MQEGEAFERHRLPNPLGEVAEWLNAAGLKPATPDRARGFESHPLRRIEPRLLPGLPLFKGPHRLDRVVPPSSRLYVRDS